MSRKSEKLFFLLLLKRNTLYYREKKKVDFEEKNSTLIKTFHYHLDSILIWKNQDAKKLPFFYSFTGL